jgi:signal recognition particle subunit SRP54
MKERENPDLLNNSRKQRIAKGCGLTQVEINRMIKQFKNAGKMAKRFSGKNGMKELQAMMGGAGAGGMPNLPR